VPWALDRAQRSRFRRISRRQPANSPAGAISRRRGYLRGPRRFLLPLDFCHGPLTSNVKYSVAVAVLATVANSRVSAARTNVISPAAVVLVKPIIACGPRPCPGDRYAQLWLPARKNTIMQRTLEITSANPIIRRVNTLAGWGILALAVMGLISLYGNNFVPSPAIVHVTELLTVAAGLFYAIFFLGVGRFGWDTQNPKVIAATQQLPLISKAYIRVPLMFLVLAGFAWMSFSNALPWALNAAIGQEGAMTVVVRGWQPAFYARFRHYCAKPTIEHVPFGMLGRRSLCVGDQHKSSEFPPGTVLSLSGRASAFGISPDKYRIVSRPLT
jgi:hypothetical protein